MVATLSTLWFMQKGFGIKLI